MGLVLDAGLPTFRKSSGWMNNKLRSLQTIEQYSAVDRNELLNHEKTWKRKSQTEKTTHCMIPIIGHSGKGKTMQTVKRLVVARVCGDG